MGFRGWVTQKVVVAEGLTTTILRAKKKALPVMKAIFIGIGLQHAAVT